MSVVAADKPKTESPDIPSLPIFTSMIHNNHPVFPRGGLLVVFGNGDCLYHEFDLNIEYSSAFVSNQVESHYNPLILKYMRDFWMGREEMPVRYETELGYNGPGLFKALHKFPFMDGGTGLDDVPELIELSQDELKLLVRTRKTLDVFELRKDKEAYLELIYSDTTVGIADVAFAQDSSGLFVVPFMEPDALIYIQFSNTPKDEHKREIMPKQVSFKGTSVSAKMSLMAISQPKSFVIQGFDLSMCSKMNRLRLCKMPRENGVFGARWGNGNEGAFLLFKKAPRTIGMNFDYIPFVLNNLALDNDYLCELKRKYKMPPFGTNILTGTENPDFPSIRIIDICFSEPYGDYIAILFTKDHFVPYDPIPPKISLLRDRTIPNPIPTVYGNGVFLLVTETAPLLEPDAPMSPLPKFSNIASRPHYYLKKVASPDNVTIKQLMIVNDFDFKPISKNPKNANSSVETTKLFQKDSALLLNTISAVKVEGKVKSPKECFVMDQQDYNVESKTIKLDKTTKHPYGAPMKILPPCELLYPTCCISSSEKGFDRTCLHHSTRVWKLSDDSDEGHVLFNSLPRPSEDSTNSVVPRKYLQFVTEGPALFMNPIQRNGRRIKGCFRLLQRVEVENIINFQYKEYAASPTVVDIIPGTDIISRHSMFTMDGFDQTKKHKYDPSVNYEIEDKTVTNVQPCYNPYKYILPLTLSSDKRIWFGTKSFTVHRSSVCVVPTVLLYNALKEERLIPPFNSKSRTIFDDICASRPMMIQQECRDIIGGCLFPINVWSNQYKTKWVSKRIQLEDKIILEAQAEECKQDEREKINSANENLFKKRLFISADLIPGIIDRLEYLALIDRNNKVSSDRDQSSSSDSNSVTKKLFGTLGVTPKLKDEFLLNSLVIKRSLDGLINILQVREQEVKNGKRVFSTISPDVRHHWLAVLRILEQHFGYMTFHVCETIWLHNATVHRDINDWMLAQDSDWNETQYYRLCDASSSEKEMSDYSAFDIIPPLCTNRFHKPPISREGDLVPTETLTTQINPLLHCAYCNCMMNEVKYCSKCKNVLYCSVECQRADWHEHSKVCKEYGT